MTAYAVMMILFWNIVVFSLFGLDKHKAKRNQWRVSEGTLLLSAALMGGPGALLGMRVFRHKTQHLKFRIGVPLLLILNSLIAAVFTYGMLRGN